MEQLDLTDLAIDNVDIQRVLEATADQVDLTGSRSTTWIWCGSSKQASTPSTSLAWRSPGWTSPVP